MITIVFKCNLCPATHTMSHTGGKKVKLPTGWGAVRPTLRVNMPEYPDRKKELQRWREFDRLCDKLKEQLLEKEYHICHRCLKLSQDKLLKIEHNKKKN